MRVSMDNYQYLLNLTYLFSGTLLRLRVADYMPCGWPRRVLDQLFPWET